MYNGFLGVGNSAVVVGYGHLGDGNLHLNVSTPKYDEKVHKSFWALNNLGIFLLIKH